ncbi:MAG: hypothetical protein K2N98_10000 [Lachnospiraceae bacterium]|nr:hypothetical protein [Lachnospiraceae bacterium]
MDENYWKDAYQGTWPAASKRENRLKAYLEKETGMQCIASGLGAGSSQYISGSAARNGYQKGDADFVIKGTNIYIEVTGPLVKTVKPTEPLWFRPDKLNNAIKNSSHVVFLAHHCMAADLWRVIHVDEEFKKRFREYQFPVVTPTIRNLPERYVEIKADDRCVRDLSYLVMYLKQIKESQTNG